MPGSRVMAARVPTTCSEEARPDWGSDDVGSLLVVTSCSVMSVPALTWRAATSTCRPCSGPGRSTLRATRTAVPRQTATTRWRCRHSRREGRRTACRLLLDE